MASTRLRLETAEAELADKIRDLIVGVGLKKAAETLGMGSAAATNIAARVPVQRGTLALARQWVGFGHRAAPAAASVVPVVSAPRAPDAPARIEPISAPKPADMARSLQSSVREVAWVPAIPWRIKVGPRMNSGEHAVLLDFSECVRAWGCTIETAESYTQVLAHVPDEVLADPACWTTQFPDAPFARMAKYAAKLVCEAHESMTAEGVAKGPPEVPQAVRDMAQREAEAEERRAKLERDRVEFAKMADEAAARQAEADRIEAEKQAAEEFVARPKPIPRAQQSEEDADAERALLIAQVSTGQKPRRTARKL